LAANHRYSLESALPPAATREDPAVRWLRGRLPGHCEFFAAAFTLIARTAGHPTRAVAGFRGGTWNPYENYFMVRHADAHAWCEVFDGAGAWLRVDPTPGGGVAEAAGLAPAVDHSFSAYADSLRMLWYRRIVGFDQGSQRRFVDGLRDGVASARIWVAALGETVAGEVAAWARRPWTLESRGDLVLVLAGLLIVAVAMRRLGIGTSDVAEWFRRGEQPTRRRAGELLRRLERRLRKRREPVADSSEIEAVAMQLETIRFGRVERWPVPARVFRAARRLW
jgi:hypothetical protein